MGVQFVFGHDSRLVVKAGKAELCGSYSTSAPPVTVYGLKSGSETRVPSAGTATLRASSNTPSTQFPDPSGAYEVGGATAIWDKTSTSTETGSFSLAGFPPPSAVPAGSHVLVARLRVTHSNTASQNADKREVRVTHPSGVTPVSVTLPLPDRNDGATYTDLLDLTSGAGLDFVRAVHRHGLTGAGVRYSAKVGHAGKESVDAVQLELAFAAPAYRAGGGCITATPFTGTGSGTCALLTSTNAPDSNFYVQGTTYAPRAALDISLNNVTGQVFEFGVIARALVLKQTGSASFSGPVIEVPDDSPGYTTTNPPHYDLLTTYTCLDTSMPCDPSSSSAQKRVVAQLRVTDPLTSSGTRQVDTLSWSVQR